jgi:hypothetical protein
MTLRVEQRRIPELYDLAQMKGQVPVPFGAKAYQLTNFKIIHKDVPPAPVMHIEPVFYSCTLGAEAGTYPETGVWYID